MRCWLILIAVLGLGFAQEPLQLQNEFSFRLNPDISSPSFESLTGELLIVKPQSTASMWYADIPEDVHFYIQFVEIPKDIEYFIYPKPMPEAFEFVLPQP